MAITMTDAAAARVSSFITNRGKGIGLRLGVKTTGCSGLAYVLEFVDELAAEDQVFEQNGVKIIVDAKSLIHLDGRPQGRLDRHADIVHGFGAALGSDDDFAVGASVRPGRCCAIGCRPCSRRSS